MDNDNRPYQHPFASLINALMTQRSLVLGLILVLALIGFEMFNYSTTEYALADLLGEMRFAGVRWATILALAFCGIDFAGVARLFTPDDPGANSKEMWFLFAAWLLAATLNALLTWWGVSMALNGRTPESAGIVDQGILSHIVPIFVSCVVWVTRILLISNLSSFGARYFGRAAQQVVEEEYYRPEAPQYNRSHPASTGTTSRPASTGTTSRPASTGTTSRPASTGTTSHPASTGTNPRPATTGAASRPASAPTASHPAAPDYEPRRAGSNGANPAGNHPRPAGAGYNAQPERGDTAPHPAANEPEEEAPAPRPSPSTTAPRPVPTNGSSRSPAPSRPQSQSTGRTPAPPPPPRPASTGTTSRPASTGTTSRPASTGTTSRPAQNRPAQPRPQPAPKPVEPEPEPEESGPPEPEYIPDEDANYGPYTPPVYHSLSARANRGNGNENGSRRS